MAYFVSGSSTSTGSFGKMQIGRTLNTAKSLWVQSNKADWIASFAQSNSGGYGVSIDATAATTATNYAFFTYTNAGTGFCVRNDGKVGIGTASPDGNLTVASSGVTNFEVESTAAYSTTPSVAINGVLKYNSGGEKTNFGKIVFGKLNATDANTAGYTAFYKKPAGETYAEAMRIDPDGKVGIGTTSPGTILEVDGPGDAAGEIKIGTYSTGGHSGALIFQTSRNATIGSDDTIVTADQYLGYIDARGADGNSFETAARISFEVDGAPGASADMPGRIGFYTTPDGSATLAERMRIDNGGKVGIGTTVPSKTLTVVGDISASGDFDNVAHDGAVSSSAFHLMDSAYINDPQRTFKIVNSNPYTMEISTNATTPIGVMNLIGDSVGDAKVGINTTAGATPAATLEVRGTISGSLIRSNGDVVAYYSSDERLKDKETNKGYLGVRHDRLVGLLVESIKEQQEQINELKLQIKEIKNGSS